MPIRFVESNFEGGGIVIKGPVNADFIRSTFTDCPIEISSPADLVEALGLRPGTPPQLVAEVLRELQADDTSPAEVESKASTLRAWLSAGSDLATIVAWVQTLKLHKAIPAVIGFLMQQS